jgi:hypothetical protein
MLFNSRIDEAGVAEEKVVSEEIRRRADAPTVHLLDEMMAITFPGHPYGDRVAGTLATTARATRIDFLDYYNATYVPNNVVLVVAGDIAAAAALERGVAGYGAIPSRSGQPPRPPLVARFTGLDSLALARRVGQAYLALSSPCPGPASLTARRSSPGVILAAAPPASSGRRSRGRARALEVSASPVLHEEEGAFTSRARRSRPSGSMSSRSWCSRRWRSCSEHGPTSEEMARAARMLRLQKLFEGERCSTAPWRSAGRSSRAACATSSATSTTWRGCGPRTSSASLRTYLVRENLKRGASRRGAAAEPPAVAGRRAAALERLGGFAARLRGDRLAGHALRRQGGARGGGGGVKGGGAAAKPGPVILDPQ